MGRTWDLSSQCKIDEVEFTNPITFLLSNLKEKISPIPESFSADTQSLSSAWNALRENCPNAEFFLGSIYLYSVRIQENMGQKNSVFGHFSRSDDFKDKNVLGTISLAEVMKILIISFLIKCYQFIKN